MSLVNEFQLYCQRTTAKNVSVLLMISMGGLLFFIANFSSDKLGRRVVLRFSMVVGLVGVGLFLLVRKFSLMVVSLIMISLTIDVSNTLAFLYMSEVSPPRLGESSSLMMLLFEFIGEIVGSFTPLLSMDYRRLMLIYFVIFILNVVFYFWLRPTFYYLVRVKDRPATLELIRHVTRTNSVRPEYIKARLNRNRLTFDEDTVNLIQQALSQHTPSASNFNSSGSKEQAKLPRTEMSRQVSARLFSLTEQDIEPLFRIPKSQNTNEISLGEYLSSCENVFKVIAYTVVILNFYWVKGMTIFLPEKMGFKSVYVNSALLATADLAGLLIMTCFLSNTRRTFLNRFHLSFILVVSVVLCGFHWLSLTRFGFVKIVDMILSCRSARPSNQQVLCGCATRLRWGI